jgi:hypothetical protein
MNVQCLLQIGGSGGPRESDHCVDSRGDCAVPSQIFVSGFGYENPLTFCFCRRTAYTLPSFGSSLPTPSASTRTTSSTILRSRSVPGLNHPPLRTPRNPFFDRESNALANSNPGSQTQELLGACICNEHLPSYKRTQIDTLCMHAAGSAHRAYVHLRSWCGGDTRSQSHRPILRTRMQRYIHSM